VVADQTLLLPLIRALRDASNDVYEFVPDTDWQAADRRHDILACPAYAANRVTADTEAAIR
jgi:hypothetical protein